MKAEVRALLSGAGIGIVGKEPWDILVRDERIWRRWALEGSVGVGESYMDGWWECEALDEFIHRLLRLDPHRNREPRWRLWLGSLIESVVNLQSPGRAFVVGEKHYDIGDEVFTGMLGETMAYSCAYWDGGACDLDEAQEHKLDMVCRKLGLQEGMRVLDIGCGWGGFCHYAASRYGVSVVGLTVSKAQQRFAVERCKGLPVEILYQDYRTYEGRFDRAVSIGMFEHVGPGNYRRYFDQVRRCLGAEGLFLLHTIGANCTEPSSGTWYTRYIFPNGYLPSLAEICAACEGRFIVEDVHSFGPNYDPTLMAWYQRFDESWPTIRRMGDHYDERFYRMWRFYLLSCAGAFRSRVLQVWQCMLSPSGIVGGWERDGGRQQQGLPKGVGCLRG